MPSFRCNLCGTFNQVEDFATEPASCPCGSNVRSRALIHLLSMELFGRSLQLTEFPALKAIRAVGMTDKECYARTLAEKFDYTNTYYDREPRLDFSSTHPDLYGKYDFILSSDVLEHVAPPVGGFLKEVHSLLKPNGFLVATVPCMPDGSMREHFPDLHEFRVVPLGNSPVLINRRRDGRLEIRDDLVFHGGVGSTLEMRQFRVASIEEELLRTGFREVDFLVDDIPAIGVLFDRYVSQPLVARNHPFVLDSLARSQLVDLWSTSEAKVRMAARSRWLRLGRALGVGPDFKA
jgi:SAM-dependent methyltransferase